jgi:hypothetical protein
MAETVATIMDIKEKSNENYMVKKFNKNLEKFLTLFFIMKIRKSKYFSSLYYKNNCTYFLFLLVYFCLSMGLMVLQMYRYKNVNIYLKVARGCGILIAFNMVFVIMLVMRRPNTWLRSTKIGRLCLPFDNFIEIHKAIGLLILVLSIIHTLGHSLNLCMYRSLIHSKL